MSLEKKGIDIDSETEEHFRLMANKIPDIIWTALPDGFEDFHNTKFSEYTGLSLEESRGFGWHQCIHPDDLHNLRKVWEDCLKSKKPYEIEYRIKNRKGEYKWFLIRAIPWMDDDGNIIKWFGTTTDIHYGKSLRMSLLQATEDLTKSNKELSRINDILNHFVYIAAHDLRSPVNNLKMLIELLHEEKEQGKSKEVLSFMEKSIYRLDRTIDALLEIIKTENEQASTKTLHFENVLAIVVADLSTVYPKISDHIVADFTRCPSIDFVQPYLVSIIKNILSNAYKYQSPKRHLQIHITTEREPEYVKITISDNGKGFNMETTKDIFGAFKRFTNDADGKGVGLFVVKNIVEKSGGRIEAYAKEDAGATFTIYLKENKN